MDQTSSDSADSHVEHPTHLRKASPDRASLLGAEVEGEVLLLLVELAEVLPLLLVHHGQHPRNGLADGVAIGKVNERGLGTDSYERTSW